jgi:hypothetical protein
MANHREGNVIYVDTDAAFADVRNVCAIKYIGNTSGTANLKGDASSSGALLWEEEGTANVFDADIEIRCDTGVYVTVTNGAVVYLYVK